MAKKYAYIPFDSKIDKNLGEYQARLPKWTPSRKAPDGRYLEVWYNHDTRDWVLQEFDREGNQIRSQYNGRKSYALLTAREWANDWYASADLNGYSTPELTEEEKEAGGEFPIDELHKLKVELITDNYVRRWAR